MDHNLNEFMWGWNSYITLDPPTKTKAPITLETLCSEIDNDGSGNIMGITFYKMEVEE